MTMAFTANTTEPVIRNSSTIVARPTMASANGRRAEIDALRSTSSAASPPTRVSNGASSWRRSATRAWAASPCVGPPGTTSTTDRPGRREEVVDLDGGHVVATLRSRRSNRRAPDRPASSSRGRRSARPDHRGTVRGPLRSGGRPRNVAAIGRRGSRSWRPGTAAPATISPAPTRATTGTAHRRTHVAICQNTPRRVRGLAGRMR